ncbi:hypothetical protein ACP70R_023373 [Stipagrostis hirtigluma subsp. patula]
MDPRALVVAAAVAMAAVAGVGGDFAADRAECADKLAGLATCLTYVQDGGGGAAPTPDCCAGLKAVLQTSRKCLCVLVKDKDDPGLGLGLKINVTKALGLPAACSAAANISDCPRLLNLPPNSKEAQVFEQYAKQQAAQGNTTATGGPSVASAGPARRWLGVRVVGDGGGARAVVLSVISAAAPLAVPFLAVVVLG